ncbi:MAG: type II secretion system protein [Helicobacteraceae bacterium]|jgi:prepilin-type N-terminal cleavage/methylation domain-containing protein|nr:type II secretion system protein [Helicobacteraceae bacterium]
MQKKAFTLIELLLVVVIIGVIYGLVINSMQKINDKEAHLSFESLPSFLESMHNQNNVAFVCIDNCRECAVYVDNVKVQEVDPFMKEERVLNFWRFDANQGTQELRFRPTFNEDDRAFDVCFRYEIFKDGSSSEMIIETQKQVFDYRGFLHPVRRYSSLQELGEKRQHELQEVLQ